MYKIGTLLYFNRHSAICSYFEIGFSSLPKDAKCIYNLIRFWWKLRRLKHLPHTIVDVLLFIQLRETKIEQGRFIPHQPWRRLKLSLHTRFSEIWCAPRRSIARLFDRKKVTVCDLILEETSSNKPIKPVEVILFSGLKHKGWSQQF